MSTPSGPLTLELLALPKEVPGLRRIVREHLGGPCAEVQLCVSEIVGHVIRHVGEGTPVVVRISPMAAGRTRVEVTDQGARALPVLLRAGGDDEYGRGLALMDVVSLRWGVRQEGGQKTVWCEIGRP
ncbi:ATP-binding protein [Streptomyces sp. NPDC048516]|uniref:ATP-binding protein n=1 Tax=Streptomyces sp. NPDC048516 TaxID=3365565 RepID=UPI00371E5F89